MYKPLTEDVHQVIDVADIYRYSDVRNLLPRSL